MRFEGQFVDRRVITLTAVCWLAFGTPLRAAEPGSPARPYASRVFASSVYSLDAILTRPFDVEVPLGSTGARIWATSPQGWAFRDDVHWIDATVLPAFDIEVRDDYGLLVPGKATYYPSHIHYEGTTRKEMTASASFTFARDRVENPLSPPFRPEKRWTCWSSGRRQDWFEVEFARPRQLSGFEIFFFDDAPQGACRPPESFHVSIPNGTTGDWNRLENGRVVPPRPQPGANRVQFAPTVARRFRLDFEHAGSEFYTGIYGIVPIDDTKGQSATNPSELEITCDKFISSSDTLVTVLRMHNPTQRSADDLR